MAKSIQISRRYVDSAKELSSYRLFVEAINAQEMSSKVFIKQRIVNFAKGTTDDIFVGVCTPAQLEDLGEDSPLEGTSYFRANSVDLVATTSEELKSILDSLIFEVKKLTDDLAELEILGDDEIYNIEPGMPVTTVANAPVITMVVKDGLQYFVYFEPPNNVPYMAVKNYEYSLNNGSTWTLADPPVKYSPLLLSGITLGQSYVIKIRAVVGNLKGKTSASFVYNSGSQVVGTIFKGNFSSEWTDVRNWTNSLSVQANSLPLGSGAVSLQHACVVNADSPLWLSPQSINIGAYNITFNSSAQVRPAVTSNITSTTGIITFNGVDYDSPVARVGSIFKGTADDDWFKISNWVTSNSLPATELPGSGTSVVLEHNCVVDVDSQGWLQPGSITISTYNITFNSDAETRPTITCNITATTGTAIFNGVDYGA
jgi:hypothetical protein